MKLTEAIAELFVSGTPAQDGTVANEFRFSKSGSIVTMWIWDGTTWTGYALNSSSGGGGS
jgi:hypothetical protein